MKHIIPHDRILSLMLAGNAELIFENPKTGNHRIYRIKQPDYKDHFNVTMSDHFLGQIKPVGKISTEFQPIKSLDTMIINEAGMFLYMFNTLLAGRLNPDMLIYHTGRCCACYKKLTDPLSIELGIGPQCRGK